MDQSNLNDYLFYSISFNQKKDLFNENIRHIKKLKLGALFLARDWGKNFNQRLNRFVSIEKNDILIKLNTH